MEQFPPRAELDWLIDDTIVKLCIDASSVQFGFASGVQLYSEEGLEQHEADGSSAVYGGEADNGPPLLLHRLLQKRIVAVDREDWCLQLMFEGGSKLSVLSENSYFESGQIEAVDGTLTVF